MNYTKTILCTLTSLALSIPSFPCQAQTAAPSRDDSVLLEEDGNDTIYRWIFDEDDELALELGGRRLLQTIGSLLDPFLYQDWETCGAVGLFLSMGEREAAAIIARGVQEGLVDLNSSSDCSSLDHIRQSLDYIDTANALRAQEGQPLLKVSPAMMAAAIIQANRSAQTLDHSKLYEVGENLAWGQQIGAPMNSQDRSPFDWWYTMEKDIFLSDPDAYEAAHFRNLTSSAWQITGFAIGSNCPVYGTVFAQTFHAGYRTTTMTTDQFRAKIDAFKENQGLGMWEPDPGTGTLMFRMYNPNSGEHFYTADRKERNGLRAAGWAYEGIGWIAGSGGSPVWRLYNPNAGDHHYTLSQTERDHLIQNGWKDEGAGWYSDGAHPLYRQYNPNAKSGSHNFTSSEQERDFLLSIGWKDESIAWYGLGGR